jgi:hypothetical protein
MELEEQLLAAERDNALRFLASAIHAMTLVGRDAYRSSAAEIQLTASNEAIHRLSGHLRDLCDLQEPLTRSRAQGIAEAIGLMSTTDLNRLLAHSPLMSA